MPHTRDALCLDPVPASVSRARGVVAARLREIDRDDLVDSAELVVSELVTNALLHAGAPITLRVRGTPRHPRIEVGDRSLALPSLPGSSLPSQSLGAHDSPEDSRTGGPTLVAPVPTDLELETLTTYGRGIHMVMTYSRAWGIDRSRSAKVVWFEPAPEARTDVRMELQIFELGDLDAPLPDPRSGEAEAATAGVEGVEETATTHRVRLVNAPVRSLAALHRHYDDLQREIRLIGLQYGRERSDLPGRLFDQAAQPELHRLRARGTELLIAAVARGEEFAHLDYQVTVDDAADFAQTVSLLLEADDFCRQERLLTLALNDRQRAIVRWMKEQIVGQVAGETLTPWCEGSFAGA